MLRRKTSYLWEYFSIIDPTNRIAQCDICDRPFRFQSTATNLRKHLDRMHPTILADDSESAAASASISASDVCDIVFEGVNGQDNQQPMHSPTDSSDYKSNEPVTYSLKIDTTEGTTNESDDTPSVVVVTDNGPVPSTSTPPDALSSVGTKTKLDTTNQSNTSTPVLVKDNRTPSVSNPRTISSSTETKRKWQESTSTSKSDEPLTVHHEQLSSPLNGSDEFDIFGMNIAAKMRKMSKTNNTQCIIAEKLISEVIYHGQLQFLTFNTVIKINGEQIN